MSTPRQPLSTPTGEFQAHFGSPPGSTELAAECKKWEKLCADLIAERQAMREELAKVQGERDRFYRALLKAECENYVCPYTKEEMLANAVYEPSLKEIVEQMRKGQEN